MSEIDKTKGSNPMRVYQFSAQARDQASQFEPLRDAILDWVSANVVSLDPAERQIAHRTMNDHNFGIAQYNKGGQRFFAIRYTRPREGLSLDADENAALKVTTEIVLKAGEKDVEVFISKSHEKRKWARLADQDQYVRPPSILPVITNLVRFDTDGWHLSPKPIEMKPDDQFRKLGQDPSRAPTDSDLMKLSFLLNDSRRLLPVIIALGANGKPAQWDKQHLELLAQRTYGFAHVIYVPYNAITDFERKLGKSWFFEPGQARQFNRGFRPSDVLTEHPILVLSRRPGERDAQIDKLVHDILTPDFKRRSAETVLTFNDVHQAVVDRDLARTDEPTTLAEALQTIRLLETRLGIAQEENKGLEGVIYDLMAESEERATADKAQSTQPPAAEAGRTAARATRSVGRKAQWKMASIEFGVPVPDRIEHVEAWAKEFFPESLLLCDPFIRECKRMSGNYKRTENFYKILTIMGIFHGAQHSENLKRLKEHYFKEGTLSDILRQHGFEASKSSTTTLGQHRTEYQAQDPSGRRWDLDWHAKDGSTGRSPENMLRLYYAEDAPHRRFVIGKGPSHLPIALR